MNIEKLERANFLSERVRDLEGVIANLSNLKGKKMVLTDYSNKVKVPDCYSNVLLDLILAEYNRQLESVKKEFESL